MAGVGRRKHTKVILVVDFGEAKSREERSAKAVVGAPLYPLWKAAPPYIASRAKIRSCFKTRSS